MAVILLEIATLFATQVPGKIDSDVLQLLWKVSKVLSFNVLIHIMHKTHMCISVNLVVYNTLTHILPEFL